MGWFMMVLGALAGAALSGGVTYGSMLAREKIVVQGAVKAERNAGVVTCNYRVGEISRAHDAEVDRRVAESIAAAGAVVPTPEEAVALAALCAADPACRREP